MFQLYRRRAASFFVFVLFAALAIPATAGASGGGGHPGERTYLITIENLTEGQPFTPPVLATHHRRTSVFDVGNAASAGIQGLAENGNVPGLIAELETDKRVDEITVADAAGPVLPGGEITVEINSTRRHRRLSIASMLICTNDGFVGLDSLKLPSAAAEPTVAYLNVYDAGTESNTEAFADLVSPCGPLTGVDSGGQGTGMSNPALAEGGVVSTHAGVVGGADLDPAIHGFAGLDGARLPRWPGESATFDLDAYDAGSELNTEAFADLVPPCGPLTGVDSGGQGTGMSNPALSEDGVITPHAGIAGVADLDHALHGWDGTVGSLSVTRLR